MCLAVPMKVIEIQGDPDDFLSGQIALVDADGIRKETRLDIVDRWPDLGDYLIIHAGFAIHTLDPQEAETNIRLMREMAEKVEAAEAVEQRT
ncbi:Hydrogenase maturation protein HypC [Desulfocapsa sulfexigens DSM 10523]|uniref:Hydrogenase maturation protein HypC n=2 Tax=Desulfocapsa TaxID=53318 RepID=M1P2L4_DESSD|nr:Hydrogenase maturation protein HypC [Desulfocapsa sulfexigens DSM 10523]